jgi:hypothetical protein
MRKSEGNNSPFPDFTAWKVPNQKINQIKISDWLDEKKAGIHSSKMIAKQRMYAFRKTNFSYLRSRT